MFQTATQSVKTFSRTSATTAASLLKTARPYAGPLSKSLGKSAVEVEAISLLVSELGGNLAILLTGGFNKENRGDLLAAEAAILKSHADWTVKNLDVLALQIAGRTAIRSGAWYIGVPLEIGGFVLTVHRASKTLRRDLDEAGFNLDDILNGMMDPSTSDQYDRYDQYDEDSWDSFYDQDGKFDPFHNEPVAEFVEPETVVIDEIDYKELLRSPFKYGKKTAEYYVTQYPGRLDDVRDAFRLALVESNALNKVRLNALQGFDQVAVTKVA
jgi:hypothetical protein